MWQSIKFEGNKVWSGANKILVDRRNEIWFWKNVYHSWLNYYYAGMSVFNVFQFTFMYTIYFIVHYSRQCRYTQCTLFLCLEILVEEEENNWANEQNIQPNNPIGASGLNTHNSPNKEGWFIFNFDNNASCCSLLYSLK